MAEPFLSEIRMVGFTFAPRGWAFCDGQILPINQNQSLFSLLGTTYGGDGRTSFGLPDLRGRMPIHASGQAELPPPGDSNNPAVSTETVMDSTSIARLAHQTVSHQASNTTTRLTPPVLAVNFCIALQGLFPSRN